jgi:hypothetical protein
VLLLDLGGHARRGVGFGQVGRDDRGAAEFAGQGLQAVGAAGEEDDVVAVAAEAAGGGLADAGGRAGDQRYQVRWGACASGGGRGTSRTTGVTKMWPEMGFGVGDDEAGI